MKRNGFVAAELIIVLFYLFLFVFGITGYVKNIIKLSRCDFEAPYKAEVLHCAGLIPPVGAVMGWINVGE